MLAKKILKLCVVYFGAFILMLFCIFLINQTNYSENTAKAELKEMKYVPDRLIIKFKSDVNAEFNNNLFSSIKSIERLDSKYKVKRIENLSEISKVDQNTEISKIYILTLPKNSNVEEMVKEYQKDPNIEYAEPDYLFSINVIPNDPRFDNQWGLHQSNDKDIDAPAAWNITKGSSDVKIAIIDTGVDWHHQDLSQKIWTNSKDPIDGVDNDHNGYIDDYRGWDFVNVSPWLCYPGEDCNERDNNPMDFHGHGTHVAGIAAAETNNSKGIAGTAWNPKIIAIRAGYMNLAGNGVLSNTDASAAIIYAARIGANIINMSWGGSYSSTIANAVDYAYSKGCVLVAAAGNSNTSQKYYPAALNKVIAVAATNSNDKKASFSNYGSWVDISAPGTNIISTIYYGYSNPNNHSSYAYTSGTSVSAPFVSGVAALVKSQNPNWSNSQIKSRILNTTDKIGLKNMGSGRLNAHKALETGRYPSGTLVKKSSSSTVYLIEKVDGIKKKRSFDSPEKFTSRYRWQDIVTVSSSELNSYPNGPTVIYRDGTLLKGSGPTVYVVENEGKRAFSSTDVFLKLGYSFSNIINTSDKELSRYKSAPKISSTKRHAAGTLIKSNSSPAIYVLAYSNGEIIKKPIKSMAVFERNGYKMKDVVTTSDSKLNSYKTGSSVKFVDGTLIRGPNSVVYVIEYGKKRAFSSMSVFSGLGYDSNNIITVSDSELKKYPDGDKIRL